ncbi:hypothetical protein HZA40_04040 [Candidatus Peregrinibacteria bacterium]|nr:hypothetical protein [Candidatus Peregrinibacteria bacterium]
MVDKLTIQPPERDDTEPYYLPRSKFLPDKQSYERILETQNLSLEARACAWDNFVSGKCSEIITGGAEKNLCVIVSCIIDEKVREYIGILRSCIDELPAELMWRARSPIAVDITHIAQKNIRGLADIHDSQHGIRVAVTQVLGSDPEMALPLDGEFDADEGAVFFHRENINGTLVHELMHKLSTQHDHQGKLLMSRSDWIAVMRANGIRALLVLSEEQKGNLSKNCRMTINPTSVDELPEDPDEFLAALRNVFQHRAFYVANFFEIVAFSGQNFDLSGKKVPPYFKNPLHDLEATRAILRRGLLRIPSASQGGEEYGYEFNGKNWQKYTLERDHDDTLETYLKRMLSSTDQLQDENFLKQVIAEANFRARGEIYFAPGRLSGEDQKNIMAMAREEGIDLQKLTQQWIVQSALFKRIAELYEFQICEKVTIRMPQGFVAMTKRGSIVMGFAPDTEGKRNLAYYRLSARSKKSGIPAIMIGVLEKDVCVGERLRLPRATTSEVRHLVSFESGRAEAARTMVRTTMGAMANMPGR